MVTKEEAIKAVETLKDYCKKHEENCKDCVFYSGWCVFWASSPGNWTIPKQRRWSDADVAMAKALKMYGYTMVEHCRDGQLLAKNGNDLWFYLPPNLAFAVMEPGDSVSLDNIIREGEHV